MQPVSHFFDQYSAKLYLDSGEVLKPCSPTIFTPENQERMITKLESRLKEKGVIPPQDFLMWTE
jgi:hypothetical protein